MKREEILNKLKKCKPNFRKKYGIVRLGIFGSVARGDIKDSSDVDAIVEIGDVDPFTGY